MKTLRIALTVGLLALSVSLGRAATILQAFGSTAVAFEAEENVTLIAGTPTSWVLTNDVTPSGDHALYASGVNGTDYPRSFASYSIKFSTPGVYKLYFRWRANEIYTDADPNSANSFYAPTVLNANATAVTPNPDFSAATVNNTRVRPESNTYHVDPENTAQLTVSQEQVDAGLPLTLTLGTREAGFMFDRIVLSQDVALTEAGFNATPNSDTDVFVQPPGATYVAFEAETVKATIIPGTPTSWVVTNDVTPSGDHALYASGVNGTDYPRSFASYSIKFSTPGVYKLYFRWRANEIYTDADPNSANSFYAPTVLNANATAVTPNPDFSAATVNNTRVRPESNTYHVDPENTAQLTVSQEQVDAGLPLVFTLGTREAGFMFDRIVLSQDQALTESGFNALENTGTALPLLIEKAVGSASLTTVKVTFNKALDAQSLDASRFHLNGGVVVNGADLDPVTLKDVTLSTTLQTEGFHYTLTVNDVADLGGSVIAPNSTTDFFAWKLAPGFTHRELYFTITGNDVASLVNATKFPNNPERNDVVKGLASINDPRAQNYGVRLTGFFIPPQSGVYDFFMYNDNDAQLAVSTDSTPAGLQTIIDATTSAAMAFDPSVTGVSPSSLVAGQRYYIQVLLKQGADYDTFVNVAARRAGDPTPVDQLPPLGGTQIGTLVDPATATLQITRQPANATVIAGNRARFEVAAKSLGSPSFYQWQIGGVDVPGATRAAFYTHVLSAADSGKQVRCVIHAGGATATSAAATVTVASGQPPSSVPYLGINFIGGDAAGASGTLRDIDVVGVVPQANFNNIAGATATDVALTDADGAPTPATINYTARTYFTGTGENTAEDVLFQGYLHNANTSVEVTLNNVPGGAYDLYAYCVGFTFNATYEQSMSLVGGETYPEYHVRAEHATDYASAPSIFRLMTSTDPNARDQGNYVLFEGVSPDPTGALTLTVGNESDNPLDIDVTPALSALQLVKVPPRLTITRDGANVIVAWGAIAAGFALESTRSLGGSTPVSWAPVAGAPNPLTGAGSLRISVGAGADPTRFYRLRK